MTIRELQPEEFYKLADNECLEPHEQPIPGVTRVVVAEDEQGEIKGFIFVQFVPHIEPIWVADEYDLDTIGKRLFDRAQGIISGHRGGFITHATNERHGKYLEHLGLTRREHWQVYNGRT